MSHEEDLIDYSDEELNNDAPAPAGSNGKKADLAAGNDVDKKGSYVGIHSTGFRDFLLKPELVRAIGDCGFEHPSEGQFSLHPNTLFESSDPFPSNRPFFSPRTSDVAEGRGRFFSGRLRGLLRPPLPDQLLPYPSAR